MLMALGALIGFEADKFAFGTSYLINLVFIGGAWGIVWSTGLSIKNWRTFWRTFRTLIYQKPYARMRVISLISATVLIITSFIIAEFQLELIGLAMVSYLLCYLTIFIKSVELSSMHKWVTPDKLTEGDWLVHAVKIGKAEIIPGKLGLDKSQVRMLKKLYAQKKVDKLLVKYGIPFAPAFLLAFITTLVFNNIILAILF